MDCQKEAFPGGEGGVEVGCGAGLELLLAPCVVCAGGGGGRLLEFFLPLLFWVFLYSEMVRCFIQSHLKKSI